MEKMQDGDGARVESERDKFRFKNSFLFNSKYFPITRHQHNIVQQ